MKTTIGELKRMIREEYLQGVPEWQLRQDASEFVDRIRDRITRFILVNRSSNSIDRKEAIDAMNSVCDELEEKVYSVLDDHLHAFTRRV